MSNFDWQTEDEFQWDDEGEQAPKSNGRNLRFALPLIIVVILGVFGLVAWRQVGNTVEKAVDSAESSITSSFELFFNKVSEGDIEVVNSLLSARDREWTAVYQQMTASTSILDRSALGLEFTGDTPSVGEIDLESNIAAAVVTATTTYEIDIGNSEVDTIELLLPTTFRKGENRWLFAPPLEEFWGAEVKYTTRHLNIIAPAKDDKIIRRLIDDIEKDITAICGRSADNSCSRANLTVVFSTDPAVLAELERPPYKITTADDSLHLPTPSLVGLPFDNDGYRAIHAGYADHILTQIVLRAADKTCCQYANYIRALMDYELSRLFLRPYPLTTIDHEILINNRSLIGDTNSWKRGVVRDADLGVARVLIDYYQGETAGFDLITNVAKLGTNMLQYKWLDELNGEGSVVSGRTLTAAQDLESTVLAGSIAVVSADSTSPIPLPTENLATVCRDNNNFSTPYRYSFETEEWTPIFNAFLSEQPLQYQTTALRPLPNRNGAFLESLTSKIFSEPALGIWQDDTIAFFYEKGNEAERLGVGEATLFPIGSESPDKTKAIFFNIETTSFYQFDSTACEGSTCYLTERARGIPIWSPNSQHVLLYDFTESTLSLQLSTPSDESEPITLSKRSPTNVFFWIDDKRFAWLDGADGTMYTSSVDNPELIDILISEEQIRDALPSEARRFSIDLARSNSANRSEVLITLTQMPSVPNRRSGIIFNADTKEMTLLPDLFPEDTADEGWVPFDFRFSSDGKKIFVFGLNPNNGDGFSTTYWVYDRDSETTTVMLDSTINDFGMGINPEQSFSEDGDWLLVGDQQIFQLITSEHLYSHYVVPPFPYCTTPIWLNPDTPNPTQ